jgi:hypothetical protein
MSTGSPIASSICAIELKRIEPEHAAEDAGVEHTNVADGTPIR